MPSASPSPSEDPPAECRSPSPPSADAQPPESSALPAEEAPSAQLGTAFPAVATPPLPPGNSTTQETASKARKAAANAETTQMPSLAAVGRMPKGGREQGPPPLWRPLFSSLSALFGGAGGSTSSSSRAPHSFGRTVEPDRIDEGLFLGGFQSVCNKEHLQSLNVASILTVARGLPPQFPGAFQYTLVEVDDMAHVDLMKHFDVCFRAIDQGRAAGGIVVHCMAGISRSVTVTVAYLMRTKRWSLKKALAHVKRIRCVANPNMGFLKQLEQYQDVLAAERRKATTG